MDVYRMILEIGAPDQRYATGATYPDCQRVTNPQACDPQGFMELQSALDYAEENGEIPIRVTSVEQVDNILSGVTPVTPDMVISGVGFFDNLPMPLLIGGAVLLLMFLSKRKQR